MNEDQINNIMMDAPIPGESLTSSPEKKQPWERAPEFTNYEKAQEYIFEMLMENAEDTVDIIDQGVPLSLLATQAAMTGFAKGKWNPDLMLLLIEPALYTLIFICEQAGIDYVLDFDEEFENLPAETRMHAEHYMQKVVPKVLKNVESKLGDQEIEDVLPPSLLAKAGEEPNMVEEGVE